MKVNTDPIPPVRIHASSRMPHAKPHLQQPLVRLA